MILDLQDEDPRILDTFLRYLYTGIYNESDLRVQVRVYDMARRFGARGLRLLAARVFYHDAREGGRSKWDAGFADVITDVFDITPVHDTVLRLILCRLIREEASVYDVEGPNQPVAEEFSEFWDGVSEQML